MKSFRNNKMIGFSVIAMVQAIVRSNVQHATCAAVCHCLQEQVVEGSIRTFFIVGLVSLSRASEVGVKSISAPGRPAFLEILCH